MVEFVEGWLLGDILGEGAYGEVRIVINKSNGEAVAMKMIDLHKHPDARSAVKKETTIHRMLTNPNIIKYFGQRSEPNMEYIFLEYASGGELFDKIEPDVGMPINDAKKYFTQLISAVEYLHSKGIAHRDLKPENLLLDEDDNLKVTDFGLATVFRLQGKERCLDKKCGTLPYVAPEVLIKPYHAEPADIWSCGITLIALLAGELPWDRASDDCYEYNCWKTGNYVSLTPWKKLDNRSLALIRKILVHVPSDRFKIKDIKQHEWLRVRNKDEPDIFIRSKRTVHSSPFCHSQPELPAIGLNNVTCIKSTDKALFSFSQPEYIEDLLVSSQLQTQIHTQSSQATAFHKIVRRMTRFFVNTLREDTVNIIKESLASEGYHYKVNDFGTITISKMDKRKMLLIFKINVIDMDSKTLVDFRLSKGCGIEFKKEFLNIKNLLQGIILRSNINSI